MNCFFFFLLIFCEQNKNEISSRVEIDKRKDGLRNKTLQKIKALQPKKLKLKIICSDLRSVLLLTDWLGLNGWTNQLLGLWLTDCVVWSQNLGRRGVSVFSLLLIKIERIWDARSFYIEIGPVLYVRLSVCLSVPFLQDVIMKWRHERPLNVKENWSQVMFKSDHRSQATKMKYKINDHHHPARHRHHLAMLTKCYLEHYCSHNTRVW